MNRLINEFPVVKLLPLPTDRVDHVTAAEPASLRKRCLSWVLPVLLLLLANFGARAAGLDQNGNQLDDVWELIYGASGLTAADDTDVDGASNLAESAAGTNPRDAQSVFGLAIRRLSAVQVELSWQSVAGKRYQVLSSPTLAPAVWQTNSTMAGTGLRLVHTVTAGPAVNQFFRLSVGELDSDSDQLTDWEELQLGFDPNSAYTGRYRETDFARVSATLQGTNVITVSAMDAEISERWPDPGLVVIRRTGGLQPLTVNFVIGGTATRGGDYTMPPGNTITLPAGAREAWIEFWPVADTNDAEVTETIILTVQPGAGYRLGSNVTATINLANETATSPPSVKAAARFLLQAAFGPDADSAADADIIPENVEEVMQRGFEGWITNQFALPVGRLQPFVEWAELQNTVYPDYNDPRYIGGELKEDAWWGRVLGAPKLWPAAPTNAPYDVLRQRVGWALSQIFVVSDRSDDLVSANLGFAHYHDTLLRNSFGN